MEKENMQNAQDEQYVPLTRYLMHVMRLSDKVVRDAKILVITLIHEKDKDIEGAYRKMKVGRGYRLSTAPAARSALEKKLEEHGLLNVRKKIEHYKKPQDPAEIEAERVHIPRPSEEICMPLSSANKISSRSQDIIIGNKTFRISAPVILDAKNPIYLGMIGSFGPSLASSLPEYLKRAVESRGPENISDHDTITYEDIRSRACVDFKVAFGTVTSLTVRPYRPAPSAKLTAAH